MAQAVLAGQDFDERAEVLDAGHPAVVDRADLAPMAVSASTRRRRLLAPSSFAAAMVTVPSSSTSIGAPVSSWMARIVLAARADQQADLLRVDVRPQQPRRRGGDVFGSRPRDGREHRAQDLDPRLARLRQRGRG